MSLNESIVEGVALEWFGEQCRGALNLTRPSPKKEREKGESIWWLNFFIPEEAREDALCRVLRVGTPWLAR